MEAIPNTGRNATQAGVNASPRMDFLVNFSHAGTHYVWIRGLALSPEDDSLNIGLDGALQSGAEGISLFGTSPGWRNRRSDDAVARIEVATPGAHVLNIWMGEDGLVVDKVLLTTNRRYVPTGSGPAESPKSEPIVAAPTIAPPGQIFTESVEVTISTVTSNAQIVFTTNGSDPLATGNIYTGPFIVNAEATVRAVATADGYRASQEATAQFTVGTCHPVRIMPLGDSITLGSGTPATEGDFVGYRRKLFVDLTGAGYQVDFVGSQNNGSGAASGASFDTQHEGRGGWRADEIATTVHDWLVANPAEVVLLHVGTNDIARDPSDSSVTDVAAILDEIDRFDPNVTVVLARIIGQLNSAGEPRNTVTQYNKNIQTLADQRIAAGDKIVVVDMEQAIDYATEMADTLHPTITGYNKMSERWFNGLMSFLPKCAP